MLRRAQNTILNYNIGIVQFNSFLTQNKMRKSVVIFNITIILSYLMIKKK